MNQSASNKTSSVSLNWGTASKSGLKLSVETVFFFSFPPRYQSQRKLLQIFKAVSLITCRYGDRHHRGQIEEAARYLVDLGIKGSEDEVSAEQQELAHDELVQFVLHRLRVDIPHRPKRGRPTDLHCARSSHPTKRQRLAKTTQPSRGNGSYDRDASTSDAQSGSATVERQMIPHFGLSPPRDRPNTMHDADPEVVGVHSSLHCLPARNLQPMYSLTSNAASFGDPLLFPGINTFSDNFDYGPFQGINTFSNNFDYESVMFSAQPSLSALPA